MASQKEKKRMRNDTLRRGLAGWRSCGSGYNIIPRRSVCWGFPRLCFKFFFPSFFYGMLIAMDCPTWAGSSLTDGSGSGFPLIRSLFFRILQSSAHELHPRCHFTRAQTYIDQGGLFIDGPEQRGHKKSRWLGLLSIAYLKACWSFCYWFISSFFFFLFFLKIICLVGGWWVYGNISNVRSGLNRRKMIVNWS